MNQLFLAIMATAMSSAPAIAQMDHSQMDHSKMNHGNKKPASSSEPGDHTGHDMGPVAIPPHAHAPTGPARAADAIWGAEAMEDSRAALYDDHGNMSLFWVQGDRLEYRTREGDDGYLWDVQGYYGNDENKLWIKSEGEGSFGEAIEQAEIQALWSHAIGPFFDLQAGIRQDFSGPDRTHLVVGAQGVAPYFLEIDIAGFLSSRGDLTARIEGEYDHRLTQKLILQPRAEINLSAQDIPELGVGSGVDSIEAGLRLRYEITPEFGPYLGIAQEWKLGSSRDFAIANGENPSVTNYVAGIRFWF